MLIKSDLVWRDLLSGIELPKEWRSHFSWIRDEIYYTYSLFLKMPGNRVQYINLAEFEIASSRMKEFEGWHGYMEVTKDTGIVIKVDKAGSQYIIGTYYK